MTLGNHRRAILEQLGLVADVVDVHRDPALGEVEVGAVGVLLNAER